MVPIELIKELCNWTIESQDAQCFCFDKEDFSTADPKCPVCISRQILVELE